MERKRQRYTRCRQLFRVKSWRARYLLDFSTTFQYFCIDDNFQIATLIATRPSRSLFTSQVYNKLAALSSLLPVNPINGNPLAIEPTRFLIAFNIFSLCHRSEKIDNSVLNIEYEKYMRIHLNGRKIFHAFVKCYEHVKKTTSREREI